MRISALASCVALSLCACKPSSSEWEYQEAIWNTNFPAASIYIHDANAKTDLKIPCGSAAALLKEMGSRHWELVSTMAAPDGMKYVFKRRHENDRQEGYAFAPSGK